MTSERPKVEIVDWTPAWRERFRQDALELEQVLPPDALVEHIGSTSVPGLAAKPTIDILVTTEDLDVLRADLGGLERLGYRHDPKYFADDPDHLYLMRDTDGRRTEHVHVFARRSPAPQSDRDFRDYLVAHPDAASRYVSAKRRAARAHPDDRGAYGRAKEPEVRAIVAAASDWAAARRAGRPSSPGVLGVDDGLAEVAARTGLALASAAPLVGGEQGGAWLVTTADGARLVLKRQPDAVRAASLVRAAPVINRAVERGWPAAAWRHWGRLSDGSGFVLQDHVQGRPLEHLDVATITAVVAANARQQGLASPDAVDDAAQLQAVITGRHPWRAAVESRSAQGAAFVTRGTAALRAGGAATLPQTDLTHGDYSSSNMIMTATGVVFVDAETVGRGTRVRDLADLYRQCVVYPGAPAEATELLRSAAVEIAGPEVFLSCFVAVSYNNLAWLAEHQDVADFDRACDRLSDHLDRLLP